MKRVMLSLVVLSLVTLLVNDVSARGCGRGRLRLFRGRSGGCANGNCSNNNYRVYSRNSWSFNQQSWSSNQNQGGWTGSQQKSSQQKSSVQKSSQQKSASAKESSIPVITISPTPISISVQDKSTDPQKELARLIEEYRKIVKTLE